MYKAQTHKLFYYCVHQDGTLHFLLYYPGDFSTSSASSSNAKNRSWENDATITLPNKRTIGVRRSSVDPTVLRLNGKEYDLRQGRIFTIGHTATIKQISMRASPVREQADLKAFVAAYQSHQKKPQGQAETTPTNNLEQLRHEPQQ